MIRKLLLSKNMYEIIFLISILIILCCGYFCRNNEERQRQVQSSISRSKRPPPSRFNRQSSITTCNNRNSGGNSVRSPYFSSINTGQNDLTRLVKELANKFKHQRTKNAEFAVLFLFSTKGSSQWINAVATCNYGRCASPCNPYPGQSENFTNYVTARPEREGHAEVIVLNRLNNLVQVYGMQHRGTCRAIMLYTWLPPCPNCVTEIHRVLRPYTTTHRVVVIYTVRGEGDFRILRNCGIEVYRVAYEEYLPPPDDN